MKKVKLVICTLLMICSLTACANKEEASTSNETKESTKSFQIVEEMTHKVGGLYENALLDWTPRFDTVYTWAEGVKLPIEKPKDAKVEVRDNYICIDNLNDIEFDKYLDDLKKQDFSVISKAEYNTKTYLAYKDNYLILFSEFDNEITYVFVITGNVKGKRDVSIEQVRKQLDEKYKEYVALEIANDSVSKQGYCEFLFISPEDYTTQEIKSLYVVANDSEILLCAEDMWNQANPFTVSLIKDEVYIVWNKTNFSSSSSMEGASPFSYVSKYIVKDGKYVLDSENSLNADGAIIGIIENDEFKFYNVKYNEKWDIHNGKGEMYLIDTEYEFKTTR